MVQLWIVWTHVHCTSLVLYESSIELVRHSECLIRDTGVFKPNWLFIKREVITERAMDSQIISQMLSNVDDVTAKKICYNMVSNIAGHSSTILVKKRPAPVAQLVSERLWVWILGWPIIIHIIHQSMSL